ncbi:histidine kinase [Nocardioides sp. 616]|uniref:sensor histidine kinase n=1 Tax=Nocardioides sp. 616 TaxID=2268090 RepID=UPI000CE2CC69|nr:histidine kinase [Nocardioides sp. 616]
MPRRVRPTALDLLVAGACGVLALAGLAAVPALSSADPSAEPTLPALGGTGWWLGAMTLLAQAAVLLLRRTAPRAVLLLAAAAVPVAAACGLGDATGLATLTVLVAVLTLGLAQPASRSWPALLGAGVLVAVGITMSALDSGEPTGAAIVGGLLQGLGTIGLPLVLAVVLTARRETRLARESQAAAVAREQDALLAAAVARERTAMARELHDIAAHHLSGIAVMTAAIGTQIDSDPAAAKEGVAQVRRQSKAVLQDLRRLVGLLREQDRPGDGATVRPESLSGVAALVEDAATAGREVGLTVLTGAGPLGAGVGPLAQLAGYRTAQEALANAAHHAPGAEVQVVLDDRAPTRARLTVRNGPPPALPAAGVRSGFGLLGMRERAELTGAELEHGPTPEGGWQVVLGMPREGDLGADRPDLDRAPSSAPESEDR